VKNWGAGPFNDFINRACSNKQNKQDLTPRWPVKIFQSAGRDLLTENYLKRFRLDLRETEPEYLT
jgi:hypothetical protein